MKLAEIRSKFLEYFKQHNHAIVKSSPLVPGNDKTLLFTNAGMVQFKDVFLGLEKRNYNKAASVQRCLRAGGKHNDLENVGYTARHHTFFEMLGNFSFGDYFKKEAIQFAWNFLTEVIKIPSDRLWVTVYLDDDESANIWLKEIKVDPNRITRCDEKDNFWSMGDTGPCGPCTEIFYDHGPGVPGGPPGSKDADLDRYVEIWNIVFMEYNRNNKGELTALPKQSVDTGMGIERLAAVVQNVHSNYEIDLFVSLINAAKKVINNPDEDFNNKNSHSYRVLADHIRSCSFLITDGVMPSNEGRGYVLRRIIRRAIRHGNKLSLNKNNKEEPFFYKLVEPLCQEMGEAYPELLSAKETIEIVLKREEEQFRQTLSQGLKILMKIFESFTSSANKRIITGERAFKLYDTYGFPIDLTMDIARENNTTVDLEGFELELVKQKERSLGSSSFKSSDNNKNKNLDKLDKLNLKNTEFTGYKKLKDNIEVTVVLDSDYNQLNNTVTLEFNTEYYLAAKSTPFYAEGGGQVGDVGVIYNNTNNILTVLNTIKINDVYLHKVILKNNHVNNVFNIKAGDIFTAEVDLDKRAATERNHSATHLLHAALRNLLGNQVVQKGSYVGPDYLRFDFAYHKSLDNAQLEQIENIVNNEILQNTKTDIKLMSPDDAIESGAIALFGEKYDEKVRVLNFGNGYSIELCGGTHVTRTGDIGLFVITSESSAASGIRRIEALTGNTARNYLKSKLALNNQIAALLKANHNNILDKINQLQKDCSNYQKELKKSKQSDLTQSIDNILNKVVLIDDIKVLAVKLEKADSKSLRDMLDKLKTKLEKAIIVLASVDNSKVSLIVGVTNNCTDKIHAGKFVNILAQKLGGKGGGRPDMAQAGASHPEKLDAVIDSVVPALREQLKN